MTRAPSTQQEEKSVTLVGFGNWGTALASALVAAGVPVREIVVRKLREDERKRAKKLGARLVTLGPTGRSAAKLDAEIFWICTPDAAIAATAAALASRGPWHRRPIVLHSSGALASTEMSALRDGGAGTVSLASVHPLMSFPRRTAVPLQDVPFAIEGDARAVRAATRLVRRLGGAPFALRTEDKALYHAFGAFASPLLASLLMAALSVGRAAGFSQTDAARRMRPIVERTVANFFENGPAQSFSGPVARGDVATVARHLAVLQAHPPLREVYRALHSFALTTLPAKRKAELHTLLAEGGTPCASRRRSATSTA
jgi:predicted short-subunit dehydrogenase-like oxidoreductase (DUF2520 family)